MATDGKAPGSLIRMAALVVAVDVDYAGAGEGAFDWGPVVDRATQSNFSL